MDKTLLLFGHYKVLFNDQLYFFNNVIVRTQNDIILDDMCLDRLLNHEKVKNNPGSIIYIVNDYINDKV